MLYNKKTHTYFLGQCNSKYIVEISNESVESLSTLSGRLENCSFEMNAFKVLSSRKSGS